MADTLREKQIAQGEEMLGDRLAKASFAKGLYFGRFLDEKLPTFPEATADDPIHAMVDKLSRFCQERIDPVAIDRDSLIPQPVIDGLGQLGVLGACLPKECGGMGLEALLGHSQNGDSRIRQDLITGRYYLRTAQRRILANLAALWDNDDVHTTETANLLMP